MISRRGFLGRAGEIAAFGAVAGTGYTRFLRPDAAGDGNDVTTATFDLEVSFAGLCFFWLQPQQTPPPTTQHILLVAPDQRPDPSGNLEQHYPRVYYDAVYDSQVAPGTFSRTVPLDETVLDLSAFKGRESTIPAIPDLLDIRPYRAKYVTPVPLPDPKTTKPPNLACRVTLPPGTATSMTTEDWFVLEAGKPSGPMKLAFLVVWTVHGIPGTQLAWKLDPLSTPAKAPITPLQPLKPSGGKIKLYISNVRLAETGPKTAPFPLPPPCGLRMPHFKAYRHLFGGPGTWPELVNNRSECPPLGTPYTCLPSGGH